jgi:P pilus assembly chaperone PapD
MFYSFDLTKKLLSVVTAVTLASTIFSTAISAQGNLLITPRRVVFDGTKRSEELNLANIGKDSATYLISFIQIRMKEDGSFEKIEQPDSAQNFADKYLRFFPRTVTLAPNEAQTVKVQLNRVNELRPGEYRSHLYFRAVPTEKPLGEKDPQQDSSISVRLIPIFGISIPVIIRMGESSARAEFSDAKLTMEKDSTHVLSMAINRTGNMSVYGDIAVDYISPNGKVSHVGVVKGLAVYTPNSTRRITLPLTNNSSVNYHSGKLHIVYSDQSGKPVRLAEDEIQLQ